MLISVAAGSARLNFSVPVPNRYIRRSYPGLTGAEMTEILNIDLNEKPIYDLLQWIETDRLSCVVAITLENDNHMSLCMEDGQVVYVSSGKDGYRLGEFLVHSGDLTDEALSKALEQSKRLDVSLSRYLTENCLISADRLVNALEQLVEKILVDVFISRNGSVSVSSPLPEKIRNSPIRIETGRIVSDALRIFDEMNRGITPSSV